MRVLLVTHAFPPGSVAGVEVYTARLARALRESGHDARVLSAVHDLSAIPCSVRSRTYETVPVTEIVSVHDLGTLEATYTDSRIDAAGSQVIAEFAPDVVHFQHLLNLSAGLVRAAREQGALVLMTLHDYWLSCPRDGLRMRADLGLCASVDYSVCGTCMRDSPYLVPPVQAALAGVARGLGFGAALHRLRSLAPVTTETALRLLRRARPVRAQSLEPALARRSEALRQAVASADRVLAPTRFARERALDFGLPGHLVRVVSLGAVDVVQLPRPARAARRFAYVGTLAPHKGAHVLLEAFGRLSAEDATLDVWGAPTTHPNYVARLRQAAWGDARVRFRGAFPEGGHSLVLSQTDTLVVPSLWWENSPLTILEARAAGVLVVASAVGGIPELIENERDGLLVPPGDVAALAAALSRMAEAGFSAQTSPPKTVREGAAELIALYGELRAERRTAAPRPGGLTSF